MMVVVQGHDGGLMEEEGSGMVGWCGSQPKRERGTVVVGLLAVAMGGGDGVVAIHDGGCMLCKEEHGTVMLWVVVTFTEELVGDCDERKKKISREKESGKCV